MGLCLPCLGGAAEDVVETPDPELKRRQLVEAAEKRQAEAANRGIKNPTSVEHMKKKKEEVERMERMDAGSAGGGGGGGLREGLRNAYSS
ncbi:small VCP/p97-interacting protein [Gastrophryne carolinensis]